MHRQALAVKRERESGGGAREVGREGERNRNRDI